MIKGRVIGEVWATKKAPALGNRRLKLVAVSGHGGFAESGRVVVAIDTLDAPTGEAVMVSFGSGARNVLRPGAQDNRDLLCDCAISQVIDGDSSE
jgi:microcompartment protein CcmK/EutM